MEFSILKDILKPKILAGFVEDWQPKESEILKYMPYKVTPALDYSIVLGQVQKPVSDVVAYDTSYPLKTRKSISKLTGSIPALRIMRQMSETDLNSFMQFNQMKDPDTAAILELVFGDIQYCYAATVNKLAYLGFQALSKGVISLDATNNVGISTTANIDFRITNKSGVSVVWSAAANTTKPITDIETVIAAANAKGVVIKKILMSATSFSYLRKSEETINFCFGDAGSAVTKFPNLNTVNENLALDGLPTIDIINVSYQFENGEHNYSNLVAWNEGSIAFLPQNEIGAILHCKTAEEEFPPVQVIQKKKDIVLLTKWSENSPIREFTSGAANAFPAIKLANQVFLLNSLNATTWE